MDSQAPLRRRHWNCAAMRLAWKLAVISLLYDCPHRRRDNQFCCSINLFAQAFDIVSPTYLPFKRATRLSLEDSCLSGDEHSNILYRNGRPEDVIFIASVMVKELMNPLGISHKNNLIVAEDKSTGKRVGWAQVRSMGYAGIESSSSPEFFDDETNSSNNFRRKVRSVESIEQDVDDEIWDDFERDPIDFPNGFASLPWSKEYRAASKAASDRQKRREERMKAELARRPQLWELSSVYVIPEFRKRGIGRELVQGVLQRTKFSLKPGKDVYALTLAKTIPWYQQLGFQIESVPPTSMALEIAAGSVITKLIGEELVCIKTTL